MHKLIENESLNARKRLTKVKLYPTAVRNGYIKNQKTLLVSPITLVHICLLRGKVRKGVNGNNTT